MTVQKPDELWNKEQSVEQLSEEVQTIIERMPIKFATLVAIILSVLVISVMTLAFTIKYPDTVDGKITITAKCAPIRMVANCAGKLHLISENSQIVKSGTTIAYIECGGNYHDICLLDSILIKSNIYTNITTWNKTLELGELSPFYNNFIIAINQYNRIISSDLYTSTISSLIRQIQIDKDIINNTEAEIDLNRKTLSLQEKQLIKDSILYNRNALSEKDYNNSKTRYFDLLQNFQSLLTNKSSVLSRINQSDMDVHKLELEENDNRLKTLTDLGAKANDLVSNIKLWKEKYLIKSSVNGVLQYLGFWRENMFVQTTQELFTVIPDQKQIYGELIIPAYGSGKVKLGQSVNIKIDNYPYDEYGMLRGIVESISKITYKIKTEKGVSDAYMIKITFPNGLVTNYGKTLNLNFESTGLAEIIINPKKLIQRLFDNLKIKSEK